MKKFKFILAILIIATAWRCEDRDSIKDLEEYTGPMVESENVKLYLSDSSVVKIVMTGKKQLQQQNGDIEFPEGMQIVFYNNLGEKITELTAQEGYKSANENIYRARGDVFVRNLTKKETLTTEELFWNPEEHTIYTDKFVTIEKENDLIKAEGMRAPEDFSTYELIKPQDSNIVLDVQ